MREDRFFKMALIVSTSVHILGFGGINLLRPLLHSQREPAVTKMIYCELEQEEPLKKSNLLKIRRPQYLEKENLRLPSHSLPNRIRSHDISIRPEKDRFSLNNIYRAKDNHMVQGLGIKSPLSKEEEAYANYYEVLREKIRRELDRTFKRFLREGEVGVSFIISAAGELARVWMKSSSGDKALDELALNSVARAAPFYPLPNWIDEKDACFNVIISFEVKK